MMAYPNRTHGIFEGENTTLHLYSLLTRYLEEHTPPGTRRSSARVAVRLVPLGLGALLAGPAAASGQTPLERRGQPARGGDLLRDGRDPVRIGE